MKTPLAVIITDTHIKDSNINLIHSVFDQVINYCLENNIDTIYYAGDWFISRKGQSQQVLIATLNIINKIYQNNLTLNTIPGNHDKTQTNEGDSFLDVFTKPHFKVLDPMDYHSIHPNVYMHFLPYYDENGLYPELLDKIIADKPKSGHHILLTHTAVNGVKNNDGNVVQGGIDNDKFSAFDIVFTGHYHDRQSIGNVQYIGSTHQANFGEDADKGLTVLYDNLGFEFVNLDFPNYITINSNVNELTPDNVQKLIEKVQSNNHYYRLKINGESNEVQSFNATELEKNGIKVERNHESVSYEIKDKDCKVMDNSDILDYFEEWAQEKKPKYLDFGRKKLKSVIK